MRASHLVLAGTAASLLLTGCGLEKPSPLVLVVSGGETVHSEAETYCFEGQDPAAPPDTEKSCSRHDDKPKLLRVQRGEQVGVDVEKKIADAAWVVTLQPLMSAGGRPAEPSSSPVQTEHYFAFTPQFEGEAPLELQVRSLASAEPGAAETGRWRFVLVPK